MRALQLILEHPIATFFIILVIGVVISGVTTDIIHAVHECIK